MNKLVSFNLKMGFVHLVQGVALLILALTIPLFRDYRPEIVGRFFRPIGEGLYAPTAEVMFELPVAILAASFILLSAIFHFLISLPF
jgi:hypothetical protein